MNPESSAAAITVAGMLGVAIVSAIIQVTTTRQVIGSELKKVALQLQRESHNRRFERKCDRLTEILSELIAATDPDASDAPNYGHAAVLINRAQILLDRQDPLESALNSSLTALGFASHDHFLFHNGEPENARAAAKQVLMAQAQMVEAARAVLAAPRVAA
jgi:hypothetical protein